MDAYIYATPEKQVELGIDNAQLTQFNAYKTQLNNDISLYTAPMPLPNKSKPTSNRLTPGFSTIKISKKATLTEQDYASLFIHQDKPRTSHTIPTITHHPKTRTHRTS